MSGKPSPKQILDAALEQAPAPTLRLIVDDLAAGEKVERREKEGMREYVTRKWKNGETSLAKVLEYLSEQEIKKICDAVSVDSHGRRYLLVERLLRIEIDISQSQLTDDQKAFIVALEGLGGKATRQQMNDALGWDAVLYTNVRNSLVDAHKVRTMRGRGYNVEIDGPRTEEAKKLDGDKEKFLDRLRHDNGMSNPKLRDELGWSQTQYDIVKQQLLDEELITIGRGRGGTVWLTDAAKIDADADAAELAPPSTPMADEQATRSEDAARDKKAIYTREHDTYAPIVEFLDVPQNWDILIPIMGKEAYLIPRQLWVMDTSSWKRDGKWLAPDVSAIMLHNSPYLPSPIIEIYSFEVKRGIKDVNVLAIHEAHGHGRLAHLPFVVFQVDAEDKDKLEGALATVLTEAGQLGIGVLSVIGDISIRDNWEAHISPMRRTIAPFLIHHFIDTRMQTHQRKKIEEYMNNFRTSGLLTELMLPKRPRTNDEGRPEHAGPAST